MPAKSLRCISQLLLISFLAAPGQSQKAPTTFDPPRVLAIVRAPDTGLNETPNETPEAFYYVDRGQESNISRGELLNVYRELGLVPGAPRPMRLFIGTMTIIESQNGSSVGSFQPNENITQPIIRFKSPIKGDIVVPRLIIDSGVLFDPAKAELKPGAAEEFAKVGLFVQNFSPAKIIIEGHTDSDGDDEFNQILSENRAGVVSEFLVDSYDFITPGMVEARGYGERQPIVPNDSPETKALNRRIEVVVWE